MFETVVKGREKNSAGVRSAGAGLKAGRNGAVDLKAPRVRSSDTLRSMETMLETEWEVFEDVIENLLLGSSPPTSLSANFTLRPGSLLWLWIGFSEIEGVSLPFPPIPGGLALNQNGSFSSSFAFLIARFENHIRIWATTVNKTVMKAMAPTTDPMTFSSWVGTG